MSGAALLVFPLGTALVNDPRSFGRLKCWVSLDAQGHVAGAAFDGE